MMPMKSLPPASRGQGTSPSLLATPILPALLRLALPNMVAMLASALATVAETASVGSLGLPSLAGKALVFPMVMLQRMLSGGAMGGRVSAAVSRALAAGTPERAHALYFSALAAGRVDGAVLAGTLRLLVVAIGGWMLLQTSAEPEAVFALVALGMAAFGLSAALAVRLTRWVKRVFVPPDDRRAIGCRQGFCCMMLIMRNAKQNSKAAAKEASHARIVSVAARAIRKTGYDGTGVADIMKQAGLTHGAFYAHFASRDAMLAEAADRAGAESIAAAADVIARAPQTQGLEAMLRAYLSADHVAHAEMGCPAAALGSEMPRQAPEVRRAATRHIKEMVDLVARQSPHWGNPGAHEQALVTVATMVGAVVLARAVDEQRLSDAICQAALDHLIPEQA